MSAQHDHPNDLDTARRTGVRRTVAVTVAFSLLLYILFFLQHV